jgi:Outer membrane protein beta-barrel domain
MKKLLIISLLLFISTTIFELNAQKLSIETGYSNPVRFGSNFSSTYLNGNQLGLIANQDLKYNFGLLTGFTYTIAYGGKNQLYPSSTVNYYTMALFGDIPLQLVYSLPVSDSFKFFTFAGPKLNIGLLQKQIVNSSYTGVPSTDQYLYSSNLLKNLNYQLGIGGGIQWSQFILKGGYDYGLNNLNKLNTGNLYQNSWYLSFAYEFASLGLFTKAVKTETKTITK